ncbi:MAG: hypothetical protein NUV98_04595 [Candidatus Roizmanbacteria bacterium]|nr:hypothetical protein [Candidatus Roizmanbacteria bacterium]
MIRFSRLFDKGQVFVRCSENEDEQRELNTLVREVTSICNTTKRTGLWIVADFEVDLKKVVVTSLEKKVELNSDEIRVLQAEVIKRLKGDCNV